ncbi:CU044_5270 family protein [Streptomyces sp. ASQP_92]|uniref:CU044_5270 family protein n=1 Tax=Streptomyces sp. ASQP_92 TaxID=2979116 RepID=UPI0021BF9F71|nr:CU044_5270 family protein [Streptomyces sp. ASQP_92]MCT9090387.1 CU044_5270 family protein [Streptomyces sp. ASQP_92]
MNTDDHQEIARLLPTPAERDLPTGRHRHHRELLMRTIEADRSRARRRLLRPPLLLPLAAAAMVVAVVLTVMPGARPESSPTRITPAAPGTAQGAAVLLDRLAAGALSSHTGPVRDDQYVYVRSMATRTEHLKPVVAGALKEREDWNPQDPRPIKETGLFREDGTFVPIHSEPTPAGIRRPTYAWLASLPTEPGALYQRIRQETHPVNGQDFDQTVFESFGNLLSYTVMPPATQAALYRAAARIPGVVEVPAGADATGRTGLAIAREDRQLGQRTEWVFDKTTLAFLGLRTYLTTTSEWGEAGTLVWANAILERAVVDRPRQVP